MQPGDARIADECAPGQSCSCWMSAPPWQPLAFDRVDHFYRDDSLPRRRHESFRTVLNHLFALLARAQRAIVVAEVALAAVYIAIDVPRGGEIGKELFPLTFTLSLVAGLLCAIAVRRRPAALVRAA